MYYNFNIHGMFQNFNDKSFPLEIINNPSEVVYFDIIII